MVNNHTLSRCCSRRMTEADIEGSKSYVDMNSWQPQASYPCGNFSDTWERTKYLYLDALLRPQKKWFSGSIGLFFNCAWRTESMHSNQLLPFYSTIRFFRIWVDLWTPALPFNRCAAPAKLPTRKCKRTGSKNRDLSQRVLNICHRMIHPPFAAFFFFFCKKKKKKEREKKPQQLTLLVSR